MRLGQHSNQPEDYDRARQLRRDATPQEDKLWSALRDQAKIHGLKFRRQHVLHPYIVDFACLKVKLAVEVDGHSHDLGNDKDSARDAKIRQMGFSVLHFTNDDIDNALGGVVHVIIEESLRLMNNQPPPPSPRPRGAGEHPHYNAVKQL